MKTLRPCLAEFLGTFYLCFAGIAAILCNTPAVGGMSLRPRRPDVNEPRAMRA